jgi:hypothetical protein
LRKTTPQQRRPEEPGKVVFLPGPIFGAPRALHVGKLRRQLLCPPMVTAARRCYMPEKTPFGGAKKPQYFGQNRDLSRALHPFWKNNFFLKSPDFFGGA